MSKFIFTKIIFAITMFLAIEVIAEKTKNNTEWMLTKEYIILMKKAANEGDAKAQYNWELHT